MAVGHGPGLGAVEIEGLGPVVESHGLPLRVYREQVVVVVAFQEIAEGAEAQALCFVASLEEGKSESSRRNGPTGA